MSEDVIDVLLPQCLISLCYVTRAQSTTLQCTGQQHHHCLIEHAQVSIWTNLRLQA